MLNQHYGDSVFDSINAATPFADKPISPSCQFDLPPAFRTRKNLKKINRNLIFHNSGSHHFRPWSAKLGTFVHQRLRLRPPRRRRSWQLGVQHDLSPSL